MTSSTEHAAADASPLVHYNIKHWCYCSGQPCFGKYLLRHKQQRVQHSCYSQHRNHQLLAAKHATLMLQQTPQSPNSSSKGCNLHATADIASSSSSSCSTSNMQCIMGEAIMISAVDLCSLMQVPAGAMLDVIFSNSSTPNFSCWGFTNHNSGYQERIFNSA